MSKTLKISNGDIVISSVTGRPVTISGIDKLKQDIIEFFTIYIQPSGFGSGLEQLIGATDTSDMIVSMADRQIRMGIEEFINIQRSDVTTYRSSDEKILGVTFINVQKDSEDPTKYYFIVNIVTESGKQVPISLPLGGHHGS